jgi:hypothetical protein
MDLDENTYCKQVNKFQVGDLIMLNERPCKVSANYISIILLIVVLECGC